MFACDLHTHTTRSDGHLAPKESIDRAAQLGLKVLAITDHDTMLPLYSEEENPVNLVKYAAAKGVELVRGIEVSCDTRNEDVHIVGLFCNWEDAEFKNLEMWVQNSRMESYREIVRRLVNAGYQISWEEYLKDAGKENCPEKVHKKELFEYLARKGYVKTWQEGKRLISETPEFSIERDKPEVTDIIHMLHRTGGTVILAHPFLIRENPSWNGKRITRFSYIDKLVEEGLDGIEACYPYDKTSYFGNCTRTELEQQIRRRYGDSGMFFSGGSDFHGDYKRGIANPRELGECGVTYEYYNRYIRRL